MISNLVPIYSTRRIATKCAEETNTFDLASSDSVGGGDIGFAGSGGSTPTDADYTAAGLHYDKSTNTWQDANGVETSLAFSHCGETDVASLFQRPNPIDFPTGLPGYDPNFFGKVTNLLESPMTTLGNALDWDLYYNEIGTAQQAQHPNLGLGLALAGNCPLS